MVFLAAICSLLLLSTEQMLILTGCATEQLAADTFRYVLSCIPGVWLEFQYDALRKFLMNQQIPSPGFWVLVGAVPAHWAMCVVLLNQIHVCDPLVAIGIAFSVKSAVSFLLLAGTSEKASCIVTYCRPLIHEPSAFGLNNFFIWGVY